MTMDYYFVKLGSGAGVFSGITQAETPLKAYEKAEERVKKDHPGAGELSLEDIKRI